MRPAVCALIFIGRCSAVDSPYIGPEACAKCHPAEYRKQVRSHHAGALRPIAQSPIYELLLQSPPRANLAYKARKDGVELTVDGGLAAQLQWAFGDGAQGITPVGIQGGRYFEHRFSYYTGPRQFALTFGHPKRVSGVEAELGVLQETKTISRCFGCHAIATELTDIRPGVTCERCHGPGRAHVAAATAGAAADVIRRSLVNPGRFPAKAQIEICGACHRLPEPGGTSPEPELEDPVSVRFAPIGLMASRCFIASKRLSCVTCHDPHDNARPRSDPSYAEHCSACHATPAASPSHCPRQTNPDCLFCHMRQAALGPYLRFTDHRIRVN